MDWIVDQLSTGVRELLGRSSGPLHLRLVFQPIVAGFLAVRAGRRDARTGQPAFLWAWFTGAVDHKRLLASAAKDVGKIFVVAVALDVVYTIVALGEVRPVQTLIVAVMLAIVPYVLLRGPAKRLADKR